MKVLLIGGSGYLGAVTSIELASAGHDVICLDPRGKPAGWEFWQPKQGNVEFVQGNVCNPPDVYRLAKGSDAIVHMAFVVGGPACKERPEEAKMLARNGTEAVIKASKDKMLVFTSSDVLYGDGDHGRCDENFPCEPTSLYGILKLECEKMVRSAAEYVILRLPSNFGVSPMMRLNLIVHYLAVEMFRRGEISLYEPEVTRTLVHVRDAAASIRHVLEHWGQTMGKVFNVSSGAWSKAEIAETIAKVCGGNVTISDDNTWNDNTAKRDFVLDCTKIRSIGWKPHFDLEHGVKKLMDYMNSTTV